jgi:hypothetical protein
VREAEEEKCTGRERREAEDERRETRDEKRETRDEKKREERRRGFGGFVGSRSPPKTAFTHP